MQDGVHMKSSKSSKNIKYFNLKVSSNTIRSYYINSGTAAR